MQCKCTIQYAGYAFNQLDEKGNLRYNEMVALFDEFPWMEQWQIGTRITSGCAACISAESGEQALWVSIATADKEPIFLLGYAYPKIVRSWLLAGKRRTVKWVDIYEATSIEIKYCYRLFFAGQTAELQKELSLLKHYDSLDTDDL
jgi:hypothetical protein